MTVMRVCMAQSRREGDGERQRDKERDRETASHKWSGRDEGYTDQQRGNTQIAWKLV